MVKVLVTGSGGLVGKALQTTAYNDDNEYIYLTSKEGDLTNEADVKALFEKHKPDIVVHLAANVGGLYKNMYFKSQMLEDNTLMNTLLLKYARQYQVQKVVVILSTCIFPDKVEPLIETSLHLGPPHPSNEGYAYAKRLMEVHARVLAEQHHIHTVCLTPTNLYGEFDNFDLENAHVIPALIRKCQEAKLANKPFIVRGSGKALRQFLYSQDFAKAIWKVVHDTTLPLYSHFICAPPSSQEVSIAYVATKIAKLYNYEHALQFDTEYADGQYKKTVDPNPYFEDFTFTSIEEGLAKTIQWYSTLKK